MILHGLFHRAGYKNLYPARRRRQTGPNFFTLHSRRCARIGRDVHRADF